jgi:hypothetical protein
MQGLFNMTSDSKLFRARHELEAAGWTLVGNIFTKGSQSMLPLYQGLMIDFFDHRAADIIKSSSAILRQNQPRYLDDHQKAEASSLAIPMYWVSEKDVEANVRTGTDAWFVGFSRISSPTNQRSMIPTIIPWSGVADNIFLIFAQSSPMLLFATLSSLVFDYVTRQKVGGLNMNFFYVEQLAAPLPSAFVKRCFWHRIETTQDWIEDRVDELIFTAYDMAPAALALGDDGEPFVWDPERRAVMRAELDAAFFHLYGIVRDDVDYILGTFPIVNRNDVKEHGEERTRRLVLDAYDRMAVAMEGGPAFESTLDPPPGEGRRHERVEEGRP